MNPEADGPNGSADEDRETGRPIAELLEQEYETSPDFVGRVRRKIYRRITASQVASYSWNLPKIVLLEMARLVGHFAHAFGTKKEP